MERVGKRAIALTFVFVLIASGFVTVVTHAGIASKDGDYAHSSSKSSPGPISGVTGTVTGASSSTLVGYNATTIPGGAYNGRTDLVSVTIADNVTAIGENAFRDCINLKSVYISSTVTTIGLRAFGWCTNLTEINVDPANPIYASLDGVLYDKAIPVIITCPAGRGGTFTIPDGITSIKEGAFESCESLTSVTIPAGMIFIGVNAFNYCINLASVTIPNSVTTIGDSAFYYCLKLDTVNMGSGVSSIGNSAFDQCPDLTEINTDPGNTHFATVDGVLYDSVNHVLIKCLNHSIEQVIIPAGIKIIGDNAFSGISSIRSVIIPGSVTEIGESAFGSCSNLTSVRIPDSVITLKDWAFGFCTNLTTATIGNNVTAIGKYAFYECSALSCLTLGKNVARINFAAFYDCSALTSLTLPKALTRMEEVAFQGCQGITTIVLNGNAPSIGGDLYLWYDSYTYTDNFWVDSSNQGMTSATTVYYYEGASGFTTPTWGGLPCYSMNASGSIEGLVTDNNGSAIMNAVVQLSNKLTTYTDINGHFLFETLPARSFNTTITKEGYKVLSKSFMVTSGRTIDEGKLTLKDNITITPAIISRSPTGNNESTLTKINVIFDQKMNQTETAISINGMNGSIAWNGNNATLTLSTTLLGNTTYKVTVNGSDLEGNSMNTTAWSFTTASVGRISGIILDASGDPVAKATVTLEYSSGHVSTPLQTTTADANGRYTFYDVAIGQYNISAIKDGSSMACSTITMTSNDVATGGCDRKCDRGRRSKRSN